MTRTADSLVVNGAITNKTAEPQQVPHLRVILRDGAKDALETRTVAPPISQLPAGLTVSYSITFAHPSITAVGADVSFAAD